jgi:hypothetical protein
MALAKPLNFSLAQGYQVACRLINALKRINSDRTVFGIIYVVRDQGDRDLGLQFIDEVTGRNVLVYIAEDGAVHMKHFFVCKIIFKQVKIVFGRI